MLKPSVPSILAYLLGEPSPGTSQQRGGSKGPLHFPGSLAGGRFWRLFVISLPGLPAKHPPACGAARQVQLRIRTTAAFVPRISSRLGQPRPALPVPPAATSAGGGVSGGWVHRILLNPKHVRVALGPCEWIRVVSTCMVSAWRAQNGMSDENHISIYWREMGSHTYVPTCLP